MSLSWTGVAQAQADAGTQCRPADMEKTIFLMKKNPARTDADFADHYIHHHAPLGKKLTTNLKGYTVNIVQNKAAGDPNAVTEHWVPRATQLLTPYIANATKEDFKQVLVDDQSLFAGFDLYVVQKEQVVLAGDALPSPLGEETPEVKTILFYPSASGLPAAPKGARRVVDNFVSHKLVYANVSYNQMNMPFWEKAPSDVAVFRTVWSKAPIKADGARSLALKEYRQIVAPAAGWCTN